MSTGGSAQRSPPLERNRPQARATRDTGERGLGLRMKSCEAASAPCGRAVLERNPPLRSYAWRREPKATWSRQPQRGVRNTTRGGLGPTRVTRRNCAEGPRARGRVRNHRSRGRNKSSASLVEGRRPGPGQVSSRHGGGVEAVSAGLVGSEERAPRKCAAPAPKRGLRQGRQRLGHAGTRARETWRREEHAPAKPCAIRRSDRRAVKRAGVQSSWAASQEVHAR